MKTENDKIPEDIDVCDGLCEKHVGEVKRVHVLNKETCHDWGEFNYCETAIKEDERQGFKVTFI